MECERYLEFAAVPVIQSISIKFSIQLPSIFFKMPIKSDITINAAAFDPAATPKATAEMNENLQKMMAGQPRWYEVCEKESLPEVPRVK